MRHRCRCRCQYRSATDNGCGRMGWAICFSAPFAHLTPFAPFAPFLPHLFGLSNLPHLLSGGQWAVLAGFWGGFGEPQIRCWQPRIQRSVPRVSYIMRLAVGNRDLFFPLSCCFESRVMFHWPRATCCSAFEYSKQLLGGGVILLRTQRHVPRASYIMRLAVGNRDLVFPAAICN